ncbi:MAG: hypothetical protein ACUVQ0_05445, partial [Thermoproteota archaeon]
MVLLTVTVFLLTPRLASAQPSMEYGNMEFAYGNCGMINVFYQGLPMGRVEMVLFGPGWSWDNPCSLHSMWSIISDYTQVDDKYVTQCASTCSFAEVTWDIQVILLNDMIVSDVVATADADSNFQAIVLQFYAPIDQFKGRTVKAVLADGSEIEVNLRETHIPGSPGLGNYQYGLAWIIPFSKSEGVLIAFLSEDWPFGTEIRAQDEREWGSQFYSIRYSVAGGGSPYAMFQGDKLRFLTVISPYNSADKLGSAVDKMLSLIDMLTGGSSLDAVKNELLGGAPPVTPTPTP